MSVSVSPDPNMPNDLDGLLMDAVSVFGLHRRPVSIVLDSGVNLSEDQFVLDDKTHVAKLSKLGLSMTAGWHIIFNY